MVPPFGIPVPFLMLSIVYSKHHLLVLFKIKHSFLLWCWVGVCLLSVQKHVP